MNCYLKSANSYLIISIKNLKKNQRILLIIKDFNDLKDI